jgi:hypothetical protein
VSQPRERGERLSQTKNPLRPPPANAALVLVVDDDPSMREALGALFRSVGLFNP